MERKVKYDFEFKLECVELVVNKHYSCEFVSNKKGISRSNIRKWVSFYREYGKSGLLARRNQIYSIAFKLKVLKSIHKDSLSLREARLRFNIPSDSIIVKWKKDFSNFGLAGLKAKPKGRKSMSNSKGKKRKSEIPLTREEQLVLENKALRCEIDFLKKLQALIQAEEKNKNRKS
jgi:transposase